MAKHNELGKIGEDIASDFLTNKGFKIITRNYRKPYGEIDIVVKDQIGVLRFIEVKSVSWETGGASSPSVSYETDMGSYRPEENVHPMKIKRLLRVIEEYLVAKDIEGDWQFDVVAVYVDSRTKTAKVRHIENIVLGS